MHRRVKLLISVTAVALLALGGTPLPSAHGQASGTAQDIFLLIEGIPGESRDASHSNEIEVLSWSWGQRSAGGAGGARTTTLEDMTFTKRIDKASPKLMEAAANGTRISRAILTVRKGGDEPIEYGVWTLKNVQVTSYQTGGSAGQVPTETFSLNFEEIKFEYTEQNPDGSRGGTTSTTITNRRGV